MKKLQNVMTDATDATEDWKTAVNVLVQVRSHGLGDGQADESFAQQRMQQMESELQRLRANLATATELAGEVSSLRDAKQQLEARVEGLERERSEHSAQISRAVSTFDLIETELRGRISEIETLKATLDHDQTLIAKLEVGLSGRDDVQTVIDDVCVYLSQYQQLHRRLLGECNRFLQLQRSGSGGTTSKEWIELVTCVYSLSKLLQEKEFAMVVQDFDDCEMQEMKEREVLAMELCRMSEERGEESATTPAKLDSLECRSEDVSVETLQKDITTTLSARKRTVLSIHSLELRLNQIIRALIARKSEKEATDKEFWKMWDEVILFAGSIVELKRQSKSDKENGDVSSQVVRNERRL